MDRRAFLKWIGVGWVASSLPVAIAACGSTKASSDPPPEARATKASPGAQNNGFVKVGTMPELEATGRIFHQQILAHAVLVVRDPAQPDDLYAFEPVCTHQGCLVDWHDNDQQIFCACHGSTFNPNGTVLKGPASRPLKTYKVKVEADSILVKVA
ncbi:MAG: ubiquinol-cytochrome c reductase iron-sulfur subunit [Cyanothece sp. SIO1E1]|nr:ubiquinol-cytochrome c reductase iron-sulfur subunit [Cyanothece sp. SIO1E1]